MKRLKSLREQKGLTQADLAKLTNISTSAIGMYEQGRREANHETLIKLANFFHVTVDYLIGQDDRRETSNTPKDLAKFLENTEVMFDGEVHHLDEEDKQKLKNALEFVFWQAKEKNKRKKQ